MALWGNSDNLTIAGAPASVTIVGTATSEFWTAAGAGITNVPTGTTIILADGDAGFAVVEAHLSDSLAKINHMSSVVGAHSAKYCNQPIALKNDPGYVTQFGPPVEDNTAGIGSIGRIQKPVGVSTAEAEETNGTIWEIGVGWVGVQTYMDNSEQPPVMRVKKEILVAASGIETGHRPYPDVFDSIVVAINIGSATVTGSATPGVLTPTAYTVGTPGSNAADMTYVWGTNDGSATITGGTTSSASIGFSTAGNYNVTCTVSSLTAEDSPASDTIAVVAS